MFAFYFRNGNSALPTTTVSNNNNVKKNFCAWGNKRKKDLGNKNSRKVNKVESHSNTFI